MHTGSCTILTTNFVILLLLIMCQIPKGKDQLNCLVYSLEESLDEFDNCDYITDKFQSVVNDLCVVQLNVHGIGSKQSSLQHLIDNCISN